MAFVVGAYARVHDAPLQPSDTSELRKALLIGPMDRAGFAGTPRLQFAWISLEGSVGEPQHREDGSLSLLWGSLYRDGQDDALNNTLLQEESGKEQPALGAISGEFGFASHDAVTDSLQLLTDKLGIRALYVSLTPDRVWFSSSLRVMERLPKVRKVMDLRAVTEMSFFGWPLGERTPYLDIRVLRPGERLRVDATRARSDFYWRWNTLPAWRGSRKDCVEDLAARFRAAIRKRCGTDARVFSLLSGGLDSRMIATALREQRVEVVACNFAPRGTQDQVYSREVAHVLGCQYSSLPLTHGCTPNLYLQLSEAWREGVIDSGGPIDRQHWVFAGIGGSTGFGAVFWDESLVAYFRSGRTREGVECFIRRVGLQLIERLYRRDDLMRMREALIEGVLEQLGDFPCEDPARSFHLFEMMNDQRRHLHAHWDNAASHGLQFHVPYFDSQFLERMLSVPLDWALYHDLYYQWLEQFDPAARSVPWQVYPGHKPCPVLPIQSLPTQWEGGDKYILSDRKTWDAPLREVLAMRPFPGTLNRNYLWYVRLRRAFGGDYGYAVEAASKFRDIWVRTCGQVEWR